MIADRWGVTDAEVQRRYPCDDLLPSADLTAWRGVTVHAAAEQVWSWVVQIRLAPYSYDWLDNRGRRSPRELRGLPDPEPGDPFSRSGNRDIGRIESLRRPQQLTARLGNYLMSYVLVPDGDDTRLLLKIVGTGRWTAPLLCLGDLVMARRQLLNLKSLAERSASPG